MNESHNHNTEIEEAGGFENLNWDDFRVFLEVIQIGSFNRAASRLNMTQATVSRRLARLEARIGVKLFDRDRRGPRLTLEGQRIYNHANVAHSALTRAASHGSSANRVEGDCKIQMSDGLASYWMTRFLAAFYSRYPGIELKLFGAHVTATDKRALFDLNIHYYEASKTELAALKLGTMHFIPFASTEYLRAQGVPRSLEDLQHHRLLDLAVYLTDLGSCAAAWRAGDGKHTVLFTNLSTCLADAVRHGAGIALLPSYCALVDPVFVPLEIGIHFKVPIIVSCPGETPRNWAVRSTIDYLRQIVFDPKNMPWFRESFEPPAEDWNRRLRSLIDRTQKPDKSPADWTAAVDR